MELPIYFGFVSDLLPIEHGGKGRVNLGSVQEKPWF